VDVGPHESYSAEKVTTLITCFSQNGGPIVADDYSVARGTQLYLLSVERDLGSRRCVITHAPVSDEYAIVRRILVSVLFAGVTFDVCEMRNSARVGLTWSDTSCL